MSEDEGRKGGSELLNLVVKPTHCASQKAYLLKRSHGDPAEIRYRASRSPWRGAVKKFLFTLSAAHRIVFLLG